MFIRKILVKLFYKLLNNHVLDYSKDLVSSSRLSYEELSDMQFKKIIKLLKYSYDHVPFYKYWFDLHQVNISEIKNLKDFSDIVPILTKNDIIENYSMFSTPKGVKYVNQSTGGSTGQTLKYKMSKKDYELGSALLLRGMGVGGYKLGDRILILAGGSLVKSSSRFKITPKLLNQYKRSSYGLSTQDLNEIVHLVNKKNIKYLRGYASSIYYLADYCANHSINISFNAIYSTAERLLDKQRLLIEKTFRCKVFNQYGLNDGGVSAYEYIDEKGFVVDMERAFLEVGNSNSKGEGSILATSFNNFAFPFIRYDTGDRGIVEIRKLKSGVKRPVITKLLGRETEYLIVNKRRIGGPVLTVLMGNTNAEQYRIIQKQENAIEIHIKKGEGYSKKDENLILESFKDNCGPDLSISFIYVQSFTNSNKHKFIISEIDNQYD